LRAIRNIVGTRLAKPFGLLVGFPGPIGRHGQRVGKGLRPTPGEAVHETRLLAGLLSFEFGDSGAERFSRGTSGPCPPTPLPEALRVLEGELEELMHDRPPDPHSRIDELEELVHDLGREVEKLRDVVHELRERVEELSDRRCAMMRQQ